MTTNFVIYESAMCCSSGVCGPNPDQSLIELQDTLEKIQMMGAKVERYTITGNPKKFKENPEVIKLIQERQMKALPITTYNGKVMRVGSYPGLDELRTYLQDSNTGLSGSEEINISNEPCCSGDGLSNEKGCCDGQNSCDISCGPNYISVIKTSNKSKCC